MLTGHSEWPVQLFSDNANLTMPADFMFSPAFVPKVRGLIRPRRHRLHVVSGTCHGLGVIDVRLPGFEPPRDVLLHLLPRFELAFLIRAPTFLF